MIDPTAAPDVDRSQTYSVPGENPLDAGDRLFSAIELACLDLIGRALGRARVRPARRPGPQHRPVLGLPVLQARGQRRRGR